MPPCKNDPTRKYKGDEPSPKGLGHCAHAESVGTTKKGLDGRRWVVRADKTGTKAWKPAQKRPVAETAARLADSGSGSDSDSENGEWFLEYYKRVQLPQRHAVFLKAFEQWWHADLHDKPVGLLSALFGSKKNAAPLPAGAAAFATYVSQHAKTPLGNVSIETSKIHVGDPYYPKREQSFPASDGDWTVKSWPATTALIARAPGITDVSKLKWKGVSCHGKMYQGVSDRVLPWDELDALVTKEPAVRGPHVVAEPAFEMRGRVAMVGYKGVKVVCVVYPTMLNNL